MQMMHNILDKLSEKQKVVFVLREIEGLSYKEITEQLDIELNQVKTDLHRARKYLRAELSKINDHGISRYQSIM
jgi:RNA polymerase sigma factor (sigma-70 family)